MAIASGGVGGYPGGAGIGIGTQQNPVGPDNYGGTGTGPSFIPEIWSGKLLAKFD